MTIGALILVAICVLPFWPVGSHAQDMGIGGKVPLGNRSRVGGKIELKGKESSIEATYEKDFR